MFNNIAIIGSSGAIGGAFTKHLSKLDSNNITIHAFSRNNNELKERIPNVMYHTIDYTQEASIAKAAILASTNTLLDMVIVTIGILHDSELLPEKSLRELTAEKFNRLFHINTILPALVAKHFLPKLNRERRSIFAMLSARAGSISDNHLGGWYAYRASKAALNMIIKNAAIEIARHNKQAIILGLDPGTVDSNLSKPFQAYVPASKLLTPEFSVSKLIEVLQNLTVEQSGKCFDWNGKEVKP